MSLEKNDYLNLLQLVRRATVNGLDEAQALVVLAVKLQREIEPPAVEPAQVPTLEG
jgi:hypothetical protein